MGVFQQPAEGDRALSTRQKPLGWKDIPIGAVAEEYGSASHYETGGWRRQRPVLDPENCVKCGLCYVYCPDASIVMTPEGYPSIRLEYCKGCGVCAQECYMSTFGLSCFKMVDEEEFR
jgi:pyruvate ferredoxin oxidoreductase delta subunit